MIFELCPTLSRDLLKREFGNTAAAFGVLVLLGFAAGMIFPDMAQQTLQNFAAQIEQLGLTDDVPQSQMMATLFFNNITASLLSMLYGLIPFLPLSALALGTNALMLGAFAAIYQQQGIGLGVYVLGVLPHGIFELSALILSCALGLLICRTGTERILKKSDTPFFRRVLDCIRVFLTFSVPLLLVAALPTMCLTLITGGVTLADVLTGALFLLVTAFAALSVGVFASAVFRRTVTATVMAYLIVFFIGVVTMVPLVLGVRNIGSNYDAMFSSTMVSSVAVIGGADGIGIGVNGFIYSPAMGLMALIADQTGLLKSTLMDYSYTMYRIYDYLDFSVIKWENMAFMAGAGLLLDLLAACFVRPREARMRRRSAKK
mgnify:CR=1 FL=1